MKTAQAAVTKARKLWTKRPQTIIVYQYEKGHWSYCTPDSPVGQDLQRCGMVSESLGILATQWKFVEIK